jgi:hypothetical protein
MGKETIIKENCNSRFVAFQVVGISRRNRIPDDTGGL